MRLLWGPWAEVELRNRQGELLMVHPGWTNDQDTLILPLRATGWFATTGEAMDAAANTVLIWVWIGETDDRELTECSWDGRELGTDETVKEVQQVTLAQVPCTQQH